MPEPILLVDDEPNVLRGYTRHLRNEYQVVTAESGPEALECLDTAGPFTVIVTDMNMPGMTGVELLQVVRARAPDTSRIMLTGNANMQTAIDAVNEGAIFRFLTKPCLPSSLIVAIDAGIEQHRLITAEREILERTLSGSVQMLTDILSVTHPVAYGRANRAERLVQDLAGALDLQPLWPFRLAAMLSQVGCVAVPEEIIELAAAGQRLSADDAALFQSHPQVGHDLLVNIPRLENIAEIVRYQDKRFDGEGHPVDAIAGSAIPIEARVLKVALDFDVLSSQEYAADEALAEMTGREGWYDPEVLRALHGVLAVDAVRPIRTVTVAELKPGMELVADVYLITGAVLVSKGQRISPPMLMRLRNLARRQQVREPVRVYEDDRFSTTGEAA